MLSSRYIQCSTQNTYKSPILNLESCEDGDVRIINDNLIININDGEVDSDGDQVRRSVPSFETAIDHEGRIEICFQNVWGAIYDTKFTNLDAAVACHQLGYSRYGNEIFIVLKPRHNFL